MPLPNGSVMDFSECATIPYSTTPLPIPTAPSFNPMNDNELYIAWQANSSLYDDFDYHGQFPKFCSQVVHDERGSLLFFIVDNNIYNKNGEVFVDASIPEFVHILDPSNPSSQNAIHRFQDDYLIAPEVTIVPKPIQNPPLGCASEFYVFYAIKFYNSGFPYVQHYVRTLTYVDQSNISLTPPKIILEELKNFQTPWAPNQLSMGISPYSTNNEYIYVIQGDRFLIFYQIKEDMNDIDLANAKVFLIPYVPQFTVSFPELEIMTNDPSHIMTIAYAFGSNMFGVHYLPWDFNLIVGLVYGPTYIVNSPSPGNWLPGIYQTVSLAGNHFTGLEFSENGQYLYLTRDGFMEYLVFDIASGVNPSTSKLYLSPMGLYNFGNSFIELGKDNNLYISQTLNIPTTGTFASIVGEICIIEDHNNPPLPPIPNPLQLVYNLTSDMVSQTGIYASGHYGFQNISSGNNYFVFPDQVDEFEFSDYYNPLGMHLIFDKFPTTLNPLEIWSPGCDNNNPWNSVDGHVYLDEDIMIPEAVEIKLENMNIHFNSENNLELAAGNTTQDGAFLTLDGSTLTSWGKCGVKDFWEGVKLNGNGSQQNSILSNNEQPVLKSYNYSKIENANIGIESLEGGIIKATETNFINNLHAIKFEPFQNTSTSQMINIDNISAFNLCTFDVNNDMFGYLAGQNRLESHVFLTGVDGIHFKECFFLHNQDNVQFSLSQDKGIISNDAGFTLTGSCNVGLQPGEACPEQHLHPGVFRNLNTGIEIYGGSQFIKINESLFEDNFAAIDMRQTEDVIIIRNDFAIGGNDYINLPASQNFGIFSEESSAYQIEENKFNPSTNSVPGIQSFGIVMKESGEAYNEIYSNEFREIYCAVNPINKNRENSISYIGLQILCNKFIDNQDYDIYVENFNSSPLNGVAIFQGLSSYGASAGNWFTQNIGGEGNYFNNTAPLTYYLNGPTNNTNIEHPTFHTPILVDPQTTNAVNSCPSQIKGFSFTPSMLTTTVSAYYLARTEYYNLLYNYNQQIDDGNTPALLTEIQNTWPQEAWDLRNDLMAISPFVSQDALLEAAFSDILPDALLLEICLANPDATKIEDFIRQVEFEIPNTLPSYMIDMIRSSWSGVTARTIIEKSLTTYGNEMNALFNVVLKDIKSRTAYSSSELINWYEERANLRDYYAMADIYLEDKAFNDALFTMNEITIAFTLDDTQQNEHDNYVTYLGFMTELHNNNKTIFDINSVDIQNLTDIAAIQGGLAAQNARNILCLAAQICEPCFGVAEAVQNKSSDSFDRTKDIPEISRIRLTPNPANNYTNLEWEFLDVDEKIQINILNSSGQIMESFHSENNIGSKQISTSKVSPLATASGIC